MSQMVNIQIDPTKQTVIDTDKLTELLEMKAKTSKPYYSSKEVSVMTGIAISTVKKVAKEKPLMIRKAVNGNFYAPFEKWEKALGLK
jgi:hypothetical protein